MDASLTSHPVSTPEDLTQRWADVLSTGLGPGELAARTLWVTLFDADGRQLPVLMPIDDVPDDPSPVFADSLISVCAAVLADEVTGAWVAMALERPGPARVIGSDRAWAHRLTRAALAADLDLRPLHIAGRGWVCSTARPGSR